MKCYVLGRALLLTTYVKFVNLFPEIKTAIQEVLNQDSNLRSADAELQQRASEYLQLSKVFKTVDLEDHLGMHDLQFNFFIIPRSRH